MIYPKTAEECLREIRDRGWSVAVHNDYKLDGKGFTFWLFTRPRSGSEIMDAVKGEGHTDLVALSKVLSSI